ncbi:hypothetical protein VPH35_087063 [Triticum aestivum]
MTLKLLAEVSPQELLVALAELQNHVLGYVKSMSLKCAVDLGITDAIHRRGGTATLADIAADTKVHPARVADLRHVLELLSESGIFSATACAPSRRWRAKTPARRRGLLHPTNDAITADSELFLEVIFLDKCRILCGLSSLVDGGDQGVIAKAYPRIECTVLEPGLDLPHVVGQAAGDHDNLRFVAGDMFESIPPTDVVLLKNIMHDWGHEDCVKILQRCKEAIPVKKAGGKVMIIDMVRGSTDGDRKISEMEALQNMFAVCINGAERDLSEWKMIFSNAGFGDDYKIMPVLGPYSVIEIYPRKLCMANYTLL